MNNLMRPLLLIFCLSFLGSAFAQETQNTHEYQLDNGLKLIVKENHRAPVVTMQVWYKVGSSYEPNGLTGISHMLEHMMFKGTQQYPDGKLMQVVEENGGRQNAATTYDYTFYYQEFAADKLPLSFELEADRMRNLKFDEKAFASEREVVREERRLRIENVPQSIAYERFAAAAYIANPYHHPVIGWASDIENYTLDDLKKWYDTWYTPNNAIVIVVGDVEPEKVLKLAKNFFGPIKSQPLPDIKPHPMLAPVGTRGLNINIPAKVPLLIMGYNTPSLKTIDDKDKADVYALDVLASILDGGNSARLQKNLVRGKEVASNIGAGYSLYSRLPTLFLFYGAPSPGHNTDDLTKAIMAEIKALQSNPVSNTELSRIKTQIIASYVYSQDSITQQANILGSLASVDLPWQEFNNYVSEIQKVTPEQVQAVAKKYLTQNRLTIAKLNPQAIKGMKDAKN